MTEDDMDTVIRADVGGEITYRDRRVFMAAVEWAAAHCSLEDGGTLRAEVAQLG